MDDHFLLKEDGYLNVDTSSTNIIYHPNLNVILVFTKSGNVKVLDINSGVILQSSLSVDTKVKGKYLPEQDRILFWDDKNIGLRADYNGVLLLDTILQTPIIQTDDFIKLELLLSEAILFLHSINNLEEHGLENTADVTNELTVKIAEAQKNTKKGIKAQKWNTICLDLPHSSLKMVANSMVFHLKRLDRHIPALAIASAINERLTELQMGARVVDTVTTGGNAQRFHMFSEAVRRKTFEQWPHMDYKWALPDQMAQAGFYHQPSVTGDDRAMCFTCNVCLVCWEKTDEPWSEHERHSPECPFVKGEYTQNVPLAITYATNPATITSGFTIMSSGDQGDIICTGNRNGEINIWNVERQLKILFTFIISSYNEIILQQQINHQLNHLQPPLKNIETTLTALCTYQTKTTLKSLTKNTPSPPSQQQYFTTNTNSGGDLSKNHKMIGTKIACGIFIDKMKVFDGGDCGDDCDDDDEDGGASSSMVTEMNNQNQALSIQHGVNINEKNTSFINNNNNNRELFLVIYEIIDCCVETSQQKIKKKQHQQQQQNTIINNSEVMAAGLNMMDKNKLNNTTTTQSPNNPTNKKSSLKSIVPEDRFDDVYMKFLLPEHDIPMYDSWKTNDADKIVFNCLDIDQDDSLDVDDVVVDPCKLGDTALKHILGEQTLLQQTQSQVQKKKNQYNNKVLNQQQQYTKVVKINDSNSDTITTLQSTLLSNTDNNKQNNLNCHVIQCIPITSSTPSSLNSYEITEIIPSCDKKFLLIVLRKSATKLKFKTTTNLINEQEFNTNEQSMDIDDDDNDNENLLCSNDDDDNDDDDNSQRVQLILYGIEENGLINPQPISVRVLDECDTPIEICMLPTSDNNGRKLGGQNIQQNGGGVFVMSCLDGSLKMLGLSSLETISEAQIDGEKFISVTYCKSLERLCGCTENGSLHFYSFYDLDADSGDDQNDDDNLCCFIADTITVTGAGGGHNNEQQHHHHDITEIDGLSFKDIHKHLDNNIPSTSSSSFQSQLTSHTDLTNIQTQNVQTTPTITTTTNLAFKKDLTFNDLKILYSLTLFDEMLTPYTAEVPGCWSELVQAQKQRSDTHLIKTWRLHNDATTWDEHIIELTLPKTVNLGHIDFKFSLYQPCPNPPTIQITLLKQNSNGLGYRMKAPGNLNNNNNINNNKSASTASTAVDENIDFNISTSDLKELILENPVLHEEYLQAHNAEILAGPFELSSCMDLCDQGGLVVLTSPKLFKAKGRNYLLHIKTMIDSSKDGQTKTRGCDWLHEISITVRGTKYTNKIINERLQRCAMLESNILLENLLKLISQTDNIKNKQNLTLDILIWIISIRLARYRSPKIEVRNKTQTQRSSKTNNINNNNNSDRSPKRKTNNNADNSTSSSLYDINSHQIECIKVIEENLKDLIQSCIVFGNRTTAHKCVKLIMLTSEGVQNLPKDKQHLINFEKCLENAILKCLPNIVHSKYAGALRWFMLLISGISTSESQGPIAEECVSLLLNIVSEINRRWNSYSSLLRTRFGLYGMPFEPELFDAELPLPTKLNSAPVTIASVIKSATSPSQLQNQTLDLKHFCISEGTELRILPFQLRQKGIGNHLKGLLEVEPLHFTCYTASEATRVENMDSQSANQSGNIIEDIIFEIPFENNIETTIQNGMTTTTTSASLGNANGGGAISVNGINNVASATGGVGVASGGTKKNDDKTNVDDDMMNNVKNILVDKIFYSAFKKHKMKVTNNKSSTDDIELVDHHMQTAVNDNNDDSLYTNNDLKLFQNNQQYDVTISDENESFNQSVENNENDILSSNTNSNKSQTQSQEFYSDNNSSCIVDDNTIIQWHKLLSLPQKQMIVIDRMHSGARRFVTLDFGSPILLTDLIIPACEELVSLFIDIWCFEEETDSIRLVTALDIGVKTLVLSDLQPSPICRFLKITVTGRYGMSATRCKIPIGSYFGHAIILENDDYADSESKITKPKPSNIAGQLKVLNSLFEDVNCRYSLSSSKLLELLEPLIKSEISNIAHMQTYLNRTTKEFDENNCMMDNNNNKLLSTYEECITFQLQLNIIRSVIDRLESVTNISKPINLKESSSSSSSSASSPPPQQSSTSSSLSSVCLDKLRVLSECLIEVLLHFIIEYGLKNVVCLHSYFDANTCNILFNTLIVSGDAHMQLATCSLLVRMCCFQPWWGDFLTNIFSSLYSSQNSKIFPQDRVFFLLTYLGRKSIAMGTCRSIVIDSILKTIAKILAPISPTYNHNNHQQHRPDTSDTTDTSDNPFNYSVSSSADLQLLSWLLLFLSVCIDDGIGKKNQGFSRWDFMSGEADMSKARTHLNNNSGKNFSRSFKKRFFQNKQYNNTNLAEKFYLMQAEALHVAHFTSQIELALKQQENQLKKVAQSSVKKSSKSGSATTTTHSSSSSSSNTTTSSNNKCTTELPNNDMENPFDKGLRSLKASNTLVVIRGLVGLLLGMDFTCNMDLFLLTCKVIARLVSACQPSIQLSKIMTTSQLQHFIRIAVWKDQQHPWAVHAITCLLQDILEADKNYKQANLNFNMSASVNDSRMNIIPTNDPADDYSTANVFSEQVISDNVHSSGNSLVSKDLSYADVVKFNQLPSLMECDDTEMEDFLEDILERGKNLIKKGNNSTNRSGLTLSYRSVSCSKDSRLEYGLESNIEVTLRRLTMLSSLNLFASLPQVPMNETMCGTLIEFPPWPEDILQAWSSLEYNQGVATNVMLMMVFDNIFADLHLQDSWLSLEQVLQLWLTLNGELSEKSTSLSGFNPGETPKIPFGQHAVHGLLSALLWHPGIKLRTWCLGFQCLTLACNPQFSFEYISSVLQDDFNNDSYNRRMGVFMVDSPNFEKMLIRFFSQSDITTSNFDVNRCAGPTICKLLHELFIWLEIKSDVTDMCYVKKKLKEILLKVVLHLVQPSGAIANQQGPIDAQSQLIKELLTFQYEKTDLGVAMSIIESVSFLAYTNISNVEKIYCQTSSDSTGSTNVFGSLFATVLGSESSRQSKCVSDHSLLVNLLKLSSLLVQTTLPPPIRRNDEPMSGTNDLNIDDPIISNESQTDEIKAEQQHNENNRVKVPCVADTVLQHYPTMTRLLGSLSHCSSSSFAMLVASSYSLNSGDASNNTLSEPQTVADAVFQLLMLLSKKATLPLLVVKPLYYFLNSTYNLRYALPKLQLSEPFLWFILKVLETPATVTIFTEMGGISVLCRSLVRSNKTIINMQPNLVSMIMQHITKTPKPQNSSGSASSSSASSAGVKKSQSSSNGGSDDLINFAPYCTITSANPTAQPADVLIQSPIASHRRARSPAWTYLFYPNESHVDLTITLPSAVLLKEIQLQPHLSTLATCPSAVSIEITRDINLGPVPICLPMSTVGMTFIRLKFAQPEIAISVVIRLYRPRDSSNIGLTQIAILGTTTFSYSSSSCNLLQTSSSSMMSTSSLSMSSSSKGTTTAMGEFLNDDESIAKSSLGWLRILAQCFSVASYNTENQLANDVVKAAAETNGFLEACCSLLNVAHSSPNFALQNLETVLLKLGLHSKEFGLKLIENLLRNSIPQTFKLCNEPVSNLLYDLCTTEDNFTSDRILAMIDWIKNLHKTCQRSKNLLYATNPYNGFVKCLASILWTAYSTNLINGLPNMITKELFDSVYQWTEILENEAPLKIAMDAMLCSICCIKPEMFPLLLQRMKVLVPNLSTDVAASISDDRKDPDSMTDDVKQEESDTAEWYSHLVIEDLSRLSLKSSELRTIALACQSPLAIQQLLDSGLPRLLISAILEFCHRTSKSEGLVYNLINEQMDNLYNKTCCLTDADKAEEEENQQQQHHRTSTDDDSHQLLYPLVNIETIADILDFFSEICSEGHMRDWLGSYEGSVFWKPLLDILCNNNPLGFHDGTNYSQLEESMIKFLSKVSSCHPKNQEVLTVNLISVIRKPATASGSGNSGNNPIKNSISGFTRRLVLQLLLESEKILISVRSYLPLQRKEQSIGVINNHPSKRPNAHHLLFYLRTHTKCRDILENYVSIYNNILPSISSSDTRAQDLITETNNSPRENRKELFDITANMGLGMEYLSVAAGVTAKDKRLKEVKNQAAALKAKDLLSKFKLKLDESLSLSNTTDCSKFVAPSCPAVIITGDTTLAQILSMLESVNVSLSTPCLTLNLIQGRKQSDEMLFEETSSSSSTSTSTTTANMKASDFEPLPSPLQIFSSRGGLSLLAHYLPTVYPENLKSSASGTDKDSKSPPVSEWVKVEQNDDIYEDVDDTLTETSGKMANISSVPQHSLAAFGLFLRLPAYSDVLLRDKIKAQCLLRLVLGVTGDGEGNEIYSLSLASSLPTLPFEVFRQLLDSSPLTTDDGVLLRRNVIEVGAIHLVLNCLGIFTHHSQNYQFSSSPQSEVPSSNLKSGGASGGASAGGGGNDEQIISDDKSHVYWAKGTGFGTGSTQQSWNVEQALLRQKSEEEHVTVLLEVISSYINPGDKILSNMNTDELIYREIYDFTLELPPIFLDLLQQSCLIPALSSYLRNDSVLDITRHIPLYRAILKVLRAIALSNQLLILLMPQKKGDDTTSTSTSTTTSIVSLLANMKQCVDTYASRLKVNKKSTIKGGQTQKVTISNIDDGDDEGLALLIPDIQETTLIVQNTINIDTIQLDTDENEMNVERPLSSSLEQRYLEVMKRLQFDTFEMIVETDNGYRFVVSHHFENNVRMAGDRGHPARVKRLAQETVTLSTSLPLSYSSSVFVRCDNDRLDIMKVLITGPADTPYANGCFEFDVYFPPDYPNSPMMINLETTGRHTVRFNPNLYNDGKVCLSVLNTWHGRPEEKWNAQTSSFLQVLVSIQSLILVPEPYFNEPGFERSRGTPSGTHSSREYNSNIYQACVRWAMIEQIKNPNPCFKDVIHTHFWLKRHEVCNQIENWISELSKPQYSERSGRTISFNSMVLRRQYRQLREELGKIQIPLGLEDLDIPPFHSNIQTSATTATSLTTNNNNINMNMNMNSDSNSTTTTISSTGAAIQESLQSIDDTSMQSTNFDTSIISSDDVDDTNDASSNMQIDLNDTLALTLNDFL